MTRTEIPGKHTPERSAIAEQIIRSRKFDLGKTQPYIYDSDSREYEIHLNGLSGFFEYIRNMGGDKLVLDLGAGSTKAVEEFQSRQVAIDINFIATALRRQKPVLSQGIEPDKLFKTSAERLNGIEDNSVSGVIARSSLAYSNSPEYAARSIDRVLVLGGALKADFNNAETDAKSPTPFSYRNRYEGFVSAFQELGYDVAHERWRGEVVVAIKPGGREEMTALKLLESDEIVKGLRDWRNGQERKTEVA